jgi:translation elongation factor EF-1alpha
VQSTISGQVLLLTGQVDERTIAKYEKEAKEKVRGKLLFFCLERKRWEKKKKSV